MTDNTSEVPRTWHDATRQWLFQQGTSTVLLFLILAWLGYSVNYAIPEQLKLVQAGYDRNAGDLKEVVKDVREVAKEYGSSVNKLAERVDDLTKRVDRLVERDYHREVAK